MKENQDDQTVVNDQNDHKRSNQDNNSEKTQRHHKKTHPEVEQPKRRKEIDPLQPNLSDEDDDMKSNDQQSSIHKKDVVSEDFNDTKKGKNKENRNQAQENVNANEDLQQGYDEFEQDTPVVNKNDQKDIKDLF